jgi:hypothetical protein
MGSCCCLGGSDGWEGAAVLLGRATGSGDEAPALVSACEATVAVTGSGCMGESSSPAVSRRLPFKRVFSFWSTRRPFPSRSRRRAAVLLSSCGAKVARVRAAVRL